MAKFIPKVVPEPTWDSNAKSPCTQFELVRAFQWYNHNKTNKDARKYLLEYLAKEQMITPLQIQAAQYLNDSWNIVDGWLARCLDRGALVPDNTLINFGDRMKEFLARLDKIVQERGLATVVVDTSNVVSIQERVTAKTDYFIMELEAKFDEFWHKNSPEDFDPYTWMIENEVKPMHAAKIAEYCRQRAKEWVSIIEGRKTDEYIKESYPRSHKEYLHAANLFLLFATDAEKLASNKNAARKPRKKKPISFEKKVKNLKFKKEDTENKLVSIDPVRIMGAEKLWVYNVKTRKLGVYVAADQAGLGVKGSAIENYKYGESIGKTLRKPKDVLPRVLDGGKIVLRKVMGEINSKSSELNGRINKDTILLRVE
jgi:hypothetical protein